VAINFPGSLDDFTNPAGGNTLDSPSHSLQHSDINDAVEAMQRKVGVGSAVAGSASAGQVLTISAAGTSTWSTPTAPGLIQLTPSSVAVGSGSSSVDANGKVSFTGVSSVSLNDVFSATYTNYLIVPYVLGSTSYSSVAVRLRVGGSDSSAAQYRRQRLFGSSTTAGADRTTGQNSFQYICSAESSAYTFGEMIIVNPFAASITTAQSRQGGVPAGNLDIIFTQFANDAATSYTGFSLIPDAGTMSGTLSVYGYR